MLKYIFLGLLLLVVVLVIVIATRPANFRVSRSATIGAPPAIIYEHVSNLHQMQEWSPFAKIDPAAKMTYSGPESGLGASFSWAGNAQAGEGSMTCTESKPHELLGYRLDFLKPFKGTNQVEFTFKPAGDQTVVTWTMTGTYNFVTKAVSLFMDCDKMCGPMFEKGLADLKGLAEAEAHK
ncbi:MAG: SRPBCC family protein [Chthoniobacter sp.]|uniref:SRPBCC family protein n=1 Tax=Chthoniobacter sp. TaxID=2510640 RepID=UPI0032ADE7C9